MQLFTLAAASLPLTAALAKMAKSDANFDDRASYVKYLNSRPDITWKAGINPRFASLPVGASKSLCGVHQHSKAELESKATLSTFSAPSDLPESFDSEENWPSCAEIISDIRDQSDCGCCWAFAAASAASDRMCIATNGTLKVPLSAQDVCFCGEHEGCNGGTLYTAWDFIGGAHGRPAGRGVVTGGQYNGTGPLGSGFCSDFSLPHCHHHGPQGSDPFPAEGTPGCPKVTEAPSCPTKCDSSSAAPHATFLSDKYTFVGTVYMYREEAKIQAAIMTEGPVEAAFTVYDDFENYVSGIYHHATGSELGGHAVKIVGWGVENNIKYWKVANSWNPFWGEKGYFRILRGTNECGIEDQITANGPTATWKKM